MTQGRKGFANFIFLLRISLRPCVSAFKPLKVKVKLNGRGAKETLLFISFFSPKKN